MLSSKLKKTSEKFSFGLTEGPAYFKEHVTAWKTVYVYVILIAVFVFLFWHLFGLQIMEGDKNLAIANATSSSTKPIRAPRGLIFDTNGNRLVVNVPAFTLYVNPMKLTKDNEEATIGKIAELINVDKDELLKTYTDKAYKDGVKIFGLERITLKSGLTNDDFLDIQPSISKLESVGLEEEALRYYEHGTLFAHTIGYVGDASQQDVEEGYDPNSQVGKNGIEKLYDETLRGTDGVLAYEKAANSEEQRVYIPEYAKSGSNLILTLDLSWQKSLTRILGERVDSLKALGGSAIIIETDTGNVKSIVSYPSYDANLFATGISSTDFNALLEDDRNPILDKSIGLQLAPGSTFKPIVAATALQERSISPSTTFTSEGCMTLPGDIKFCEADGTRLGTLRVDDAIGRSSNVFFCSTGLELTESANGIRTLMTYADQFGIGRKTGIGISGEQPGRMASPELMLQFEKRPWYLGDICNTAIGQGLVSATPIQMVRVTAAIANGGKVYKPNLVKEIQDQEGNVIEETVPQLQNEIAVDDNYLELIKQGMYKSVNGERGTGNLMRGAYGNPYSKTGSADATEYIDGKPLKGAHSWVIGGFEHEGKEYSFVVHITLGGRGYQSVPVVKDFLNCLGEDFAGSKCQ